MYSLICSLSTYMDSNHLMSACLQNIKNNKYDIT